MVTAVTPAITQVAHAMLLAYWDWSPLVSSSDLGFCIALFCAASFTPRERDGESCFAAFLGLEGLSLLAKEHSPTFSLSLSARFNGG